jgi:hypothetical protein
MGGPSRLTTRRLMALIDNLGGDSAFFAAAYGEGFTLSQLLTMETPRLMGGQVHEMHPRSPARAALTRARRARDRAEHYQRQKALQEAKGR